MSGYRYYPSKTLEELTKSCDIWPAVTSTTSPRGLAKTTNTCLKWAHLSQKTSLVHCFSRWKTDLYGTHTRRAPRALTTTKSKNLGVFSRLCLLVFILNHKLNNVYLLNYGKKLNKRCVSRRQIVPKNAIAINPKLRKLQYRASQNLMLPTEISTGNTEISAIFWFLYGQNRPKIEISAYLHPLK